MPHLRLLRSIMLFSFVMVLMLGCSPADSLKSTPAFDEDRAFDLLVKQVEFGPRYPNTPGHKATAEFLQQELSRYADGVRVQECSHKAGDKTLHLKNIIAHFNPGASRWVLLAAHWDTRPIADHEATAEKKAKPIPGANDGASGVAVLLELARMFKEQKPDVGVLMVLFDGEDYGPTGDDMFLGSKYFAANLDTSATVNGKPTKIEYGILLDMIGDRNLNIHQELNSLDAAPEIVEKVWSMAARKGYEKYFIPSPKYRIMDDHVPLIEAGVKCIDVIDFDYAPWHTLDDTPDKCSPQSLRVVGEVIAAVVYQEKAR